MKKILCASLVGLAFSSTAFAQANNVGNCGWGSKLFEGQRGVFPQVLAVTTNGTFGNQTFAISSGTSGCTQDGVVSSSWKTAMFIDSNKNKLARDMSVGEGETIGTLATLMGMSEEERALFFRVAKAQFGNVFPHENVTTPEIAAALNRVLASEGALAKYTVSI